MGDRPVCSLSTGVGVIGAGAGRIGFDSMHSSSPSPTAGCIHRGSRIQLRATQGVRSENPHSPRWFVGHLESGEFSRSSASSRGWGIASWTMAGSRVRSSIARVASRSRSRSFFRPDSRGVGNSENDGVELSTQEFGLVVARGVCVRARRDLNHGRSELLPDSNPARSAIRTHCRSHRIAGATGFEPKQDGRTHFVRALRLAGFESREIRYSYSLSVAQNSGRDGI